MMMNREESRHRRAGDFARRREVRRAVHKMLDAVGDLCLAGAPILGRYVGNRSGHAMTNRLLRALFADPDAFRLIEAGPAAHDLLPGIGVHRADLLAVA